MAKKKDRKPRNEYIQGTTKGEVSEIVVTVDDDGTIRFGTDMINVFSEISYDRPKGPKVLTRIPQTQGSFSFDAFDAVAKNFDFLCAVDTNTRRLNGKNVSVVGVLIIRSGGIPAPQGLKRFWRGEVPFCLAYVEIKSKPENFGWLATLEHFKNNGYIDGTKRTGMIVDSDLGNIAAYNQRTKPVDLTDYLPENVQLIYASADAGKENPVNKFLSDADSASSQVLQTLASMTSLPFHAPADTSVFEGYLVIRPNIVEG